MRSFEQLIEEADPADLTGWSFDWLAGRATEKRPPWGYARPTPRDTSSKRFADRSLSGSATLSHRQPAQLTHGGEANDAAAALTLSARSSNFNLYRS
jgi:hypothetical protein